MPVGWAGETVRAFSGTDRACVCFPDALTWGRLLPGREPGDLAPDEDFAPCSMNGAAFVLTKEAIERVGLFDEGYQLCFEDWDMWVRLLKVYGPDRIGTYLPVFIDHKRSATIGHLPDRQARVDASRSYFWEKWQGQEALVDWFKIVNDAPLGTPRPEIRDIQ